MEETKIKIRAMMNKRRQQNIKSILKEMVCEHKWHKYGFGYECKKCKAYTGLNTPLNKLIDKLLNS